MSRWKTKGYFDREKSEKKINNAHAFGSFLGVIREIPDHATFRVKGANLAWLDKLGVVSLWPYVIWPSLTICGFQRTVFFTQFQYVKKCMDCSLFPNVNHGGLEVFCIFLKYILK